MLFRSVQKAGAAALAERLRARQEQANAGLAGALEDVRQSDLHGRLLALARAARDA